VRVSTFICSTVRSPMETFSTTSSPLLGGVVADVDAVSGVVVGLVETGVCLVRADTERVVAGVVRVSAASVAFCSSSNWLMKSTRPSASWASPSCSETFRFSTVKISTCISSMVMLSTSPTSVSSPA